MPKPIDDIKEDIQNIIFSINLLESNINELKQLNKEILDKLNKKYIKIEKPTGWFY